MIYYALRSSRQYFELINRVHVWPEEHHLLSVVGGLAFLHAVGPRTSRLTLVDKDGEVLDYANMILAIIRRCRSLAEFVELLSGHEVLRGPPGALTFGAPVDRGPLLERLVEKPTHRALFGRTYGKLEFDPRRQFGRIGESTILFTGQDLSRMVFSWRLGEGAWSSDERFKVLQAKLESMEIEVCRDRLEEIDYGSPSADIPLLALVSNCDSPMFTPRDRIFRRMRQTLQGRMQYFSWIRCVELGPPDPESADGTGEITGHELYEFGGREAGRLFPKIRLRYGYRSLAALERTRPHGAELLVCSLPFEVLEAQIAELLDVAIPAFKRLVFPIENPAHGEKLLSLLDDQGVGESYFMGARLVSGRDVIICTLRGFLPPWPGKRNERGFGLILRLRSIWWSKASRWRR